MTDSEKYCEGRGERVFHIRKIEKLLKFKIYKQLKFFVNYNVPFA